MKTITLKGSSGTLDITRLTMGHNKIEQAERRALAHRCFDRYLAAGGNCFDTARLYGDGEAETYLGAYLRGKPRDSFTVCTKGGHHDCGRPPKGRLTRDILTQELETSLKLLGLDYVDVLYLHRDDIYCPVEEIMPILAEFVRAGKVRFLGASNWTAGRIAEANAFAAGAGLPEFAVSQICWALALTTNARSGDVTHVVMDTAEYLWYKENNFPVMAWSPSARGYLTKRIGGEVPANLARMFGYLKENDKRAERVRVLAGELGVPPGAVVLSYLMSHTGFPTVAIAAFSSEAQLEEALVAEALTLTPEQRGYLAGGLPL
ncbi:MAG: aldo/keto reductase [Oscillospiraceae bacterium]|jgi:aryl-alcohol dehydrogenase-like predicted oxidoreductase|nr:aldo/keto reductase [Oscillospiraceae bacterium]